MAYYGINFRADSAYVTDGAGETYTIGAAYPETRGGITFGYSSGAILGNSRDRDNTNDRRIAGLVYSLNSSAADVFQVDLPEGAGTYDIAIALGDAASARGNQLLLIKDGSTTLATIGPTSTTAADRFLDATGVERTDAAWPGSMALLRLTFSGSVMNLHIGNGGGGDVTGMCHVGWTKVASSSTDQAADRTGTRLNRPGRGPYSLGRYHIRTRLENFASTDVAQSLTGVAATGAVGTVTQTASFALTGNAGTSAVGIVTPSIAQVLTGVAATGAAGTAKSSSTCALTGNAATSAAGTVTASISQALTTVAGTGAVGTLVSGISYALTGLVATGAVGNVTANGAISFQLSGVAATGAPGALVPAISYAGSGNVATGVAGSVGAAPSYAVSGTAGTGSVGTLKSTITYPLTGSAGAGEAGSVGASSGADVSRALSGVAATAALGTLVANLSRGLAGISATAGVGSLTNPAEATFTADSRQRIGAASTAAASQRIGRSPT